MSALERFFRERSRSSFASLARAHGRLVFRTALRITGDRAAAEDIAQEVFLRLLRAEPREVRSEGGFLAWQAIALARSHLRSESRRKTREEEAVRRRMEEGQAGGLSAEDRLALQEEVERLPEDLRGPIELHYFSELTFDEVALALGISRRTVATRLSDGKERLRSRLAPRLLAGLSPGGSLFRGWRPSRSFRRKIARVGAALPGTVPSLLLFVPLNAKAVLLSLGLIGLAVGGGVLVREALRPAGGDRAPLVAENAAPTARVPNPAESGVPGRDGGAPAGGEPEDPPAARGPVGLGNARSTVRGRLVDGFTGKPVGGQKVFVRPEWWMPERDCPSATTAATSTSTSR